MLQAGEDVSPFQVLVNCRRCCQPHSLLLISLGRSLFLRWTVSIGPGTKRTDCPLQFHLPGDHHHRNKSCLYLSDKHPTHQLNEIKYSEKCLILKVLFAKPGGRGVFLLPSALFLTHCLEKLG